MGPRRNTNGEIITDRFNKSIREIAASNYWTHCKSVFRDIFRNHDEVKNFIESMSILLGIAFHLLCIIAFPVMVPIGAIFRRHYAVKAIRKWEYEQDERDSRMKQRVSEFKRNDDCFLH